MSKATSMFVCGLLLGILFASGGFALIQRHTRGQRDGVTVLKLAHCLDQSHPVHQSMVFMGDRLREKSAGSVEVQIYPNSQLGAETVLIEQLQRGAIAMAKTSAAPMESFVPEMAVFGVPYAFRDEDHFWRVANGDLGRQLLLAGKSVGVLGLCYFDAGARSFYTVEKPVLTPNDLDGQKIRVQKSKTAMDMVEALGGSPTPIPWGELYTALQQSMVDGAENNPPSFYANRHFEVCKHLSLDEHARVPDMLLMSGVIWDSLSPQVQQWVQAAADEASQYQRKLWREESDEAIAAVQEEGVTVHRPEKQAFVDKCQAMRASFAGSPVGELLQQIDEQY